MSKIEIINPLEDLGKDTKSKGKKNIFKDKKFLIIAGAVALVGLYAGFKKNKSNTSEETSVVIPTGYTGYPSASTGESLDYTASEIMTDVTDVLNSYISETDSKITDIQSSIDSSNSAVYDNISKVQNMLADTQSSIDKQASAMEEQNAINRMMINSDLYTSATTTAEKNALHEENKAIADKYGFTFNDNDGYWYKADGTRVYQTAIQQANENNTSVKNNGYTSAIAQMKANSEAYNNASASEKERLHNENMQIASDYGLTYNSSDGYYYTSDGQKAYTPNTSSTNKSTSSSSTVKSASTGTTSGKSTSSSSGTSSSKSTSSSSSKSTSSSSSVQTQKSKDSTGRTVVYTNSGSGWQFAGYE